MTQTQVTIHMKTGRVDRFFPTYEVARYFVLNNISYSGPDVRRVEIIDHGSTFPVRDYSWDDGSKLVSLANTKRST